MRSHNFKDLKGLRFGKLQVVSFHDVKNYRVYWNCLCDCGNKAIVFGDLLKNKHTKSCGCFRKTISRNNSRKLAFGEGSFNALYQNYLYRAKKQNIEFLLTKDEFRSIIIQNCYYCGQIPKSIYGRTTKYNGIFIYNGIDRVDNTKGYIIDNCVSCCTVCNSAKNSVSISICRKILEFIDKSSLKELNK